ncbi:MAG: hypothetical protein PXY39_02645, partial [archaeon]|nr:hypothetical protein [archaeon]
MMIKDKDASDWRKAHKKEIEADLEDFLKDSTGSGKDPKTVDTRYDAVAVLCSSLGWKRPNDQEEEKYTEGVLPHLIMMQLANRTL